MTNLLANGLIQQTVYSGIDPGQINSIRVNAGRRLRTRNSGTKAEIQEIGNISVRISEHQDVDSISDTVAKFVYEVWGNAVNVASRMESAGEPDQINLSADPYEIVKDFFECEYRGELNVKNKKAYSDLTSKESQFYQN